MSRSRIVFALAVVLLACVAVGWCWLRTGDPTSFASGTRALGDAPVTIESTVPPRDKPGPVRLVVKLLRPDGSLAMERSLAY